MKIFWSSTKGSRMVGLSLVLATALLAGCSGGSDSGGGTTTVVSPTGTVTGQVASAANNAPVAGATVSTTAGTTTSAADGSFTVTAGVGDRTVIHVEAIGFAETFPVARVTAGQTTGLGIRLLPTGVSTAVIVANGGTVTVPNSSAKVSIPANGLVPKAGGAAAGTVNVAVTPINPSVDVKLMPGDFMAVPAGGGLPVPIESFGAMLIDIRDDSGMRYTLAAGKTSTIRIPVGTLSAAPPATSPLFFFDESTGLWKEEGTATLQGTAPNQFYEGTVTHFSYWNADKQFETVFISGCVRDTNGQPVAGVFVLANGLDYSAFQGAITQADGTFRVPMRATSVATLSATSLSGTERSNTVNVGPSNVDFTVPTCLVMAPGPLTITTSPVLPIGKVGLVYNQTLTASGGIPEYTWSFNPGSNPLPEGLALDPSGVITGTPTTAGTTTITVKVVDTAAGTVTQQLSLTIIPQGAPLAIASLSPLPAGTVGTVYSTTLVALGGTPALSWSVISGALPIGLALNPSTGRISGTPTTPGTATFTIRVQDSGTPQQSAQQQFSLTTIVAAGGGGGTLTVSGTPASFGGTFVADPLLTKFIVFGTIVTVSWETVSRETQAQGILFNFDTVTGTVASVAFSYANVAGQTGGLGCNSLVPPGCTGVTVNRTAGTFTLVNTVLTDSFSSNPPSPITLNGTLTFTPF